MDIIEDSNDREKSPESQNDSFKAQYVKLMQETVIVPTDDYIEKTSIITELVRVNMPKSLYRFRTCNENSLDAYLRDHIYHSKPISFNDPHDCLVFIDKKALVDRIKEELTIEHLQTLLEKWHNWEQMPDSFFSPYLKESIEMQEVANRWKDITTEQLRTNFDAKYGELRELELYIVNLLDRIITVMYKHFRTYPKIACFSENILSTLMWAHYADYHKGFALEYDFTQNQSKCFDCQNKCNDFAFMNLYPVIYGNKRYDVAGLTYFMLTNELLKDAGLPVPVSVNIPDQLIYTKVNLYKGVDWEYEKEWRSILTCVRNPENHKVTVKPKAIYLGANIAPIYQEILANYALEKNIEVYQMIVDVSVKEYKLTHRKLVNKS